MLLAMVKTLHGSAAWETSLNRKLLLHVCNCDVSSIIMWMFIVIWFGSTACRRPAQIEVWDEDTGEHLNDNGQE